MIKNKGNMRNKNKKINNIIVNKSVYIKTKNNYTNYKKEKNRNG